MLQLSSDEPPTNDGPPHNEKRIFIADGADRRPAELGHAPKQQRPGNGVPQPVRQHRGTYVRSYGLGWFSTRTPSARQQRHHNDDRQHDQNARLANPEGRTFTAG